MNQTLSLESIKQAKETQKELFVPNFSSNLLTWKDMANLYDTAIKNNAVKSISFNSLIFHAIERFTNLYDDDIAIINDFHPGKKLYAMSILHFFSNINSDLQDEYYEYIKNKNMLNYPNKPTEEEIKKMLFYGQIHTDPTDNFFIQYQGQTLWKVFDQDKERQYTLTPGDLIFIPKELIHSVSSIGPRFSISIAYASSLKKRP